MARNPKKTRKRSRKQRQISLAGLEKANDQRRNPLSDTTNKAVPPSPSKVIKKLTAENTELRKKVKKATQRYWNAQRRHERLVKTDDLRKGDLKQAKEDSSRLRGVLSMLGKEVEEVRNSSEEVIAGLKERIERLIQAKKDLANDHAVAVRRCRRLQEAKKLLKKRMEERSHKHPTIFRMMHRGRYTPAARKLARLMVSAGAAETRVGEALVEIGKTLGIQVSRRINKRTVQRIMLEQGVAADIQLVYEILNAEKITFSSDSTSHRHIEYECRSIALQVVDYSDPSKQRQWKTRTLGVGTSVNHTSQTQVDGLKARLEELATVFNNSPLAKREGLRFSPDDFAYRLIGTSGDHAADQKAAHEIMRVWRLEAIFLRLGEEALFQMDVARVIATLMPMKARQIEAHGGQEAWDALPETTRLGADLQIIRDVGKQVFEALPEAEQQKLTRFIRTGCCMHKDLNTVKGGVKSMAEMWTKENKTPPRVLANKDNAAVLANRSAGSEPTAAEKRAEEVSKRGAVHATTLGGMIFRNKDKKKGQHDTYLWWMEQKLGFRVPYPDVSNTRYGSHGEAAATILVYRLWFLLFMADLRDAKDKPGETNIEKNFHEAIQDIPTLTELCVLALYFIAVSRPFMQHVRKHDNILDLRGFFERKVAFLQSIIDDPSLWTGDKITHKTACLDGLEWDEWSLKVLEAVQKLKAELPDLNQAIVAFLQGAKQTFVERFSDEFKPGSDIDQLTQEELKTLYFGSTNDPNEGGLGSWRRGQDRRPAETLQKFNASFVSTRNDTDSFVETKLTAPEDQDYIMRAARDRDESGHQKELKAAQIRATQAKIVDNREKLAKREERKDKQAQHVLEAAKCLVLAEADIDRLTNDDLNRQLDCHRAIEKLSKSTDPEKVPLKSHMKAKPERAQELRKAVARFQRRGWTKDWAIQLLSGTEQALPAEDVGMDWQYESDNDDLT
ncbi:hypothetical protein CVT26_015127 [Gymnopilus dilepis]|uniref:Uncharacterized protein n=1 Tax=Gymnopilus dilepis TaxID=231916 RepID=A0A409YEU6_9AGAR|nr:hypothetical protein CVT26_015127 [Gymnopilus dilepis]